MSYADMVFVSDCSRIIRWGYSDASFDVRPKWSDGTPAHTKKMIFVENKYQLNSKSIPVMTLRKQGIKKCH